MRKLLLLLIIPFLLGAAPTRQYSNTSGQVIDPDKVTSNEDVIYLYLQQGVEVYKDASITGDDLVANIAITSSGNMTFSGTTNLTGTFQINGTTLTATASNLNALSGITASASELNILDGATLSTAELNYVDGVTSAIQTQLDGKSATTGNASIVTVGTITTGGWNGTAIPVAYGGTGATSAVNARSNLGLIIGTDVQAWDADLDDLADGSISVSKVSGAAASGANTDITSLGGITTANGTKNICKVTSFSGTGASNAVAHGLGRTPVFVIVAVADTNNNQGVYWVSGMQSGYSSLFGSGPSTAEITTVDGTNVTLAAAATMNQSGHAYTMIVF